MGGIEGKPRTPDSEYEVRPRSSEETASETLGELSAEAAPVRRTPCWTAAWCVVDEAFHDHA